MNYIPQMHPSFDEKEADALSKYILEGGWGTEHIKTRELESMICDFTGAKYCAMMPNGTLSLSVALMAGGVTSEDEVIVPDYTMVATPNAVELIGASAVFADVEPDTLCIDFEEIKAHHTIWTKAVIVVSINGRYPTRFHEIVEYCKEHNLLLIEDAAQSLGSYFGNTHLGRIGDIGSFSFSAPKIISTGQGGCLITDNEELFAQIKLIKDFGRAKNGEDHYLIKGWNFKFSDFQAVVGIEQMKKLQGRVDRKRWIISLYHDRLAINTASFHLFPVKTGEETSWFMEIVCGDTEERLALKNHLHDSGIGSRIFYPALHSEPAYDRTNLNFPVSEYVSQRGLWLPSSTELSDEEVELICYKIQEFY